MKYCIVYNLVAYFGWGHNLEDYLGCLIACNNLKSHTKVSSLIYIKSRKVEALLTEDCTKTLLQRKEWGMCGNNIHLNSYGTFYVGREWTQTFTAGGWPKTPNRKSRCLWAQSGILATVFMFLHVSERTNQLKL